MNVKNQTKFVERTDALNALLRDMNKYKPMSAEAEKTLFQDLNASKEREAVCKASGDFAGVKAEQGIQTRLKQQVSLSNLRFVYAVAKRYDATETVLDLVNVGTIGLYEAIETFNVETGTRFITHTVNYIRRAIVHYMSSENLLVRSTNNTRILPKVKHIENDFFQEHGRKPTGAEVMEILEEKYNITVKDGSDLCEARVEYIDSYMGDDEENVFENSSDFTERTAVLNTFDEACENDGISYNVHRALASLPERESTIVKMAFGLGYDKEYTNQEIAEILGFTTERIRQLKVGALKKLEGVFQKINA